jgi:hypothetical protein
MTMNSADLPCPSGFEASIEEDFDPFVWVGVLRMRVAMMMWNGSVEVEDKLGVELQRVSPIVTDGFGEPARC